MDLPQNLVLMRASCQNSQRGDAAWQADTGGWWDTCSPTKLNPRSCLTHSYVSPSSGLKGLEAARCAAEA